MHIVFIYLFNLIIVIDIFTDLLWYQYNSIITNER